MTKSRSSVPVLRVKLVAAGSLAAYAAASLALVWRVPR
jgi:hypothetical protein